MHEHLEIVVKPNNTVESMVKQIMDPFDENGIDEDTGHPYTHAFWDWYRIGGRWSGVKTEHRLGIDNISKFREELVERKITVSALQFGKQEIQPASQIETVDRLWQEHFPDGGDKCILFNHARDQYAEEAYEDDVCFVRDLPATLEASRVIIACHPYSDDTERKAYSMYATSIWNGCSIQKTDFKGSVHEAIVMHNHDYRDCKDGFLMVEPDWLCVTVDYHS